jgi:hypothetical protein
LREALTHAFLDLEAADWPDAHLDALGGSRFKLPQAATGNSHPCDGKTRYMEARMYGADKPAV